MKPKVTALVLLLLVLVLTVLLLAGSGGTSAVSGPAYVPWGDDVTWDDPTTVATMYLGSDLYGVGIPCSVAEPLNPKEQGTVRIINIDGRSTDQIFEVKGEWVYADALHRCEYPYCGGNGWCDGFDCGGKATTALTGALVIPPGSVDPSNPTDTPVTVHVVLKGFLEM